MAQGTSSVSKGGNITVFDTLTFLVKCVIRVLKVKLSLKKYAYYLIHLAATKMTLATDALNINPATIFS